MTDEQIKDLIHMNQRLSLILGYSSCFLHEYRNIFSSNDKEKFEWLNKAIENLFYLNKPLPEMP
jgi:hypothetical protein